MQAKRWDEPKQEHENGLYLGHLASLTVSGPWAMKSKSVSVVMCFVTAEKHLVCSWSHSMHMRKQSLVSKLPTPCIQHADHPSQQDVMAGPASFQPWHLLQLGLCIWLDTM